MKILVVDDEQSFGALLGRVLRKLGHKTEVTCHPEDALERFRAGGFDAVITDIDMPGMSGVELARVIRKMESELPIAFCTGSAPSDSVIRQAESIGRVLPKVWTVADVRAVVRDLTETRARLARGSRSRLPAQPREEQATPTERRRTHRRIKVTCRDWTQVAKLCDEQAAGTHLLTIRGNHSLAPGDRLMVALSLPDELVLSIAAEVRSVQTDAVDGSRATSILMVGLTPEICTRLRAMCHSAGVGGAAQQLRRRPRASRPPRASSPGNVKLRRQIDDLGKKLKN